MAPSRITFNAETRPGKRARLIWRPWWRGGRVVLLLEEQAEKGWTVRHRTVMRAHDWTRGFEIARTWMGIGPGATVTTKGAPHGGK